MTNFESTARAAKVAKLVDAIDANITHRRGPQAPALGHVQMAEYRLNWVRSLAEPGAGGITWEHIAMTAAVPAPSEATIAEVIAHCRGRRDAAERTADVFDGLPV